MSKRRKNPSTPWGTTGDASPFQYGGGIIYKNDDDHYVWVVWPHIESDTDDGGVMATTPVYVIHLDGDLISQTDWADLKDVAETHGTTRKELKAAARSDDPFQRVWFMESIAGHHGYENLDSYPRQMKIYEIVGEYGEDHARAVEAESARRHGNPRKRSKRINASSRMTEDKILYETEHMYVVKTSGGYEIRLNGDVHATVVGTQPTLEKAKQTMDRLERYPKNLAAFHGRHRNPEKPAAKPRSPAHRLAQRLVEGD
jgi:hypothetical protein